VDDSSGKVKCLQVGRRSGLGKLQICPKILSIIMRVGSIWRQKWGWLRCSDFVAVRWSKKGRGTVKTINMGGSQKIGVVIEATG